MSDLPEEESMLRGSRTRRAARPVSREKGVFVEEERFIFSDLNTWGWIILFIGIIQLFAAFSIWSGGQFGRWIGIIGASLSAIGALLSIPGYPFWSLAIFGLDLLIIYGLSAYGGQRSRAA
jgi:hypothetical protein